MMAILKKAVSRVGTRESISTETSSKKVWKYSNRLRKCILDTETRIDWQIAKEKREVWENNSKTLCPELNNETNLTLDDEFFIALEY